MNQLFSALKSFIFFSILFYLSVQGNTCLGAEMKPQEVTIIKNLQNDLVVYDEELQNYLPYIYNSPLNFPTLSYYLNLNLYAGYKIRHCLPAGSSLFIDQKIVDFTKVKSCKIYNIDSLKSFYQKDTLFITIFNTALPTKDLSISVIAEQDINLNKEELKAGISIISRDFTAFNDFFIVGLILLMIFIAILYNKNIKYFQEFYNLPKALSFKIRDESYISVKNISGTYLFFLFVHSFVVGFIALTIFHYHKAFRNLLNFFNTDEFWAASLSWLYISIIIFVLFILKYILVKAISQLFNIKGFSTVHFFDYVRMSISFFLLMLITFSILLFAFSFEEQFWFKSLIHGIIFFYILRIIVLFFKLYKYAPFRNLHLFLYICSTELLPLMIGIKIFIK